MMTIRGTINSRPAFVGLLSILLQQDYRDERKKRGIAEKMIERYGRPKIGEIWRLLREA